MNRRKVLLGSGAALSASLAGCSSASDNEGDSEPVNSSDGPDPEEPIDPDPIEFELIEAMDDRWPMDETELLSLDETLDPTEPLYDLRVATGDSSAVTEELSFDDGFLVIVFEHDGDRFSLDLEGETERRVISEFETAEGMELVRNPSGEILSGEYVANVEADGNWEIILAQPSTPDNVARTPPFEASGEGVDIIGPMKSVSLSEIVSALEHDEEKTMVAVHREDPETDIRWMEIDVDGTWRIEADS